MIAFYHYPCKDGMAAATLWNEEYPDCELIPYDYGNLNLDLIRGKSVKQDVYFLDCSPKLGLLKELLLLANKVIVIDHHVSAGKELVQFSDPSFKFWYDVNRSGAWLVWEYLNPFQSGMVKKPPLFIQYIDDWDRWQFKLDSSKILAQYMSTVDLTIDWYSYLLKEFEVPNVLGYFMSIGQTLLEHQNQVVKRLVENKFSVFLLPPGETEGIRVWCVNTPTYISEVGHELAKIDGSIGLTFFVNSANKYVYSLRSIGDFDVSKIAVAFGGGGHKNAAGFTVDCAIHS